MKGLIIKDFINMKSYTISVTTFIFVYGVIQILSPESNFLSNVLPFIGFVYSLNMFYYDELSKWEKYVLGFPLKKKDIVISRYLSTIIITFFVLIIAELFTYASGILRGELPEVEFLVVPAVSSSLSIIVASVFYPVLYCFGVNKGKFLLFIAGAISVAIAWISISNVGTLAELEKYVIIGIATIPFIAVFALIISCFLSVKFYGKKI